VGSGSVRSLVVGVARSSSSYIALRPDGATQVRVDAATLALFLAGIDLGAARRRWFKGRAT